MTSTRTARPVVSIAPRIRIMRKLFYPWAPPQITNHSFACVLADIRKVSCRALSVILGQSPSPDLLGVLGVRIFPDGGDLVATHLEQEVVLVVVDSPVGQLPVALGLDSHTIA